jgi:hypothetical protein
MVNVQNSNQVEYLNSQQLLVDINNLVNQTQVQIPVDEEDGFTDFLNSLNQIDQNSLISNSDIEQYLLLNDVFAIPSDDNSVILNPQDIQKAIDIIEDEGKSLVEKISELTDLANNINNEIALNQTFSSYIDALIGLQSQENLSEMNNQATQSQAILDEQLMALRNNYLIFSQQLEQYTLDEQTKEKVKNLMFELTFNMTTNRFQLSKTVVGAAKY